MGLGRRKSDLMSDDQTDHNALQREPEQFREENEIPNRPPRSLPES